MKKMNILWMAAALGICQSAAAIEAGKTYRIALASNTNKSLFVQNANTSDKTPVVVWTETHVPAQQWKAEMDAEGQFAFKNVYSGKYMIYASNSVSLYSTAISTAWWTLEPQSDDGNTCYLKRTSTYLRANTTGDGTMLKLGDAQEWVFEEVTPQPELDNDIRLRMADGFLRQYLQDKGNGYRTFVNGGWSESETMEALLDMYEATGDRRYLSIFESCYSYLKYRVGNNWNGGTIAGNYNWFGYSFNDDVMWQIIGAARAHLLTGNKTYLDDAKRNFDLIWQRAYLGYVGLLRWAEQNGDRNSANSCVNGPAEVAACYIAMGTGDESYFEKAKLLYENQRKYLANMSTGQVYDSAIFDPNTVEVKERNTWASTYNQGTMLGGALLLYRHYGDEQYRTDANKIIGYSKANLCDKDGIIKVCQYADEDYQGFKGILMRYAWLYVSEFDNATYRNWLNKNAMRAYNNMNSRGFGHSAWLTKSAEDLMFGEKDYSGQAFGASTALSAAFGRPSAYTSSSEVEDVKVSEDGGQTTVTCQVSRTGHYRITLYGKTDKATTASVAVNDGEAITRPLAKTGEWCVPMVYFVTLHEGENTIAISSADKADLLAKTPAIGYLSPLNGNLEAEYGITKGQAGISNDNAASGGRYVGFIGGNSSNTLTFYYDAEKAGEYDIQISYFTGEDRKMFVCINDGDKTLTNYSSTGSFNANTARTKTVRATLKTGTNTIILGNGSGWAPNIDKISLARVDETSGIKDITDEKTTQDADNKAFDIQGRRLSGEHKGLKIVRRNGGWTKLAK